MPIFVRLDMLLAKRKVAQNELAEKIGIAPMNLSRIKTGRIRAIRFSTLEALCSELKCQPGDLLEFITEEEAKERGI